MKKWLVFIFATMLVFALIGCAEEAEVAEVAEPETSEVVEVETPDGPSFADNVLTTDRMIIEITDYRVIPVGEEGNQFGDAPVIAFWYSVTNLTDDDLNPATAWIMTMSAFQDNDPNMDNELSVGLLPDDNFLETQMANISKDGTLENAVAYVLDDEVTPVELRASENLGMTTFGSMTFGLE